MIVLAYVHAFTDRTGKRRHYFRRGKQRVALPGLPGSQEFMAAYAAAVANEPIPEPPQAAPGSLKALAERYYASPKYLRLSATTRANYRRTLDAFLTAHGHRLVAQMRRQHVDAIIGGMADRPGAAIVLHKCLRIVLGYAVQLGWIDHNPAARAESFRSTAFHTWTEEEIARFEERWPVGTTQRLAFALLLYTGQRGSDVHRMTWPDEAGFHVVQQKTKARLTIPVHAALAEVLAATRRAHVAILTTALGQPFSGNGFQKLMSRAIRAAGLPAHCKAHGLRKAAARRLAEADATAKQIGAITGHRTLAEIERYTAAADQPRLARQGMSKIRQIGASDLPIAKNGKQ